MSGREPQPIHLTLWRTSDSIAVDLADTGALIPRSEAHVDDAFLSELVGEMEHLAARRGTSSGGDTTAGLARIGGLIFSHLLTEPARRCLRDASSTELYLRLDERLVHIPWELCHDGEEFLINRFRVGRQVMTAQPIPDTHATSAARGSLRVLLVADPTESLPHAAAETEQLCAMLDDVPGVQMTLLAGTSVRRVPLLAALQEHDVVHFAGHSHYEPSAPGRSGWRLGEGVLTAAELAKLRPPPFLVFSNSCAAATTASWSASSGYEPQAFGIGSAFLLAGVPNYVGTFWVVHDAESTDFAIAFYRSLVGGARLGEALRDARQAVIAAHGREGVTWASYSLYGDPALAPLAARTKPPAPIITLRGFAGRERYRFDVSLGAAESSEPPLVGRVVSEPRVVGRDGDLARLQEAFQSTLAGTRSMIFVSGPPGIGKTALVETFAARVRADNAAWVARGQAVEQYGSGEAYLPLLEALGRLGREPQGRSLVEMLRRHAPTWLAQLPELLAAADHEALLRGARGSSRERMLRELAELFEAATVERPLLLVLEDLHWSDPSTLDAIAYLAQRREPARLLVVGTYRPAEVLAGDHPLRTITQELGARRQSREIKLEPLGAAAVEKYLRGRLDSESVDPDVSQLIHRRTEGHPLFFVSVVDFALNEGLLVEENGRWVLREEGAPLASRIPDGLRPMIERQVEALSSEEQSVLEAAAVAGAEFSIAEAAAALERNPEEVDDRCEALAWRGQLLRSVGIDEWPDGTLSGRYRFTHALYQNALYDRVAAARRVRLHRRIAERKEQAFGARAIEIAGELAVHFQAARDLRRAVGYRRSAGEVAVHRHADHEAVEHFRHALDLLPRLADAPDRTEVELDLLIKLATPLMSTHGYAARDVGQVFERAHALSRQIVAGPHLAPLLRGLASFYQVRAKNAAAREVGEELLAYCEKIDDPVARVQAHYGHGVTLYNLAEVETAREHLERVLALYDPKTHPTHVEVYGGYDPGVGAHAWLGWIAWLRGTPDRAIQRAEEAVALAEQLGHRFSLAFACLVVASVHLYRGEAARAAPYLARAKLTCEEDGFEYQGAVVLGAEGWFALSEGRAEEAVALLEESIRRQEATGAEAALPGYLQLLGYAKARLGHVREGLEHVEAGLALAERNGEVLFVAQMLRARANLLRASGGEAAQAEVEACHRRAWEVAQRLRIPVMELDAGMGLAQILLEQERRAEARDLLAPLCARLEGVVDGAVLRVIRRLLDAS